MRSLTNGLFLCYNRRMDKLILGWKAAHSFVAKEAQAGRDVYWDGWDIVIFEPNPAEWMRNTGAFRNGKWGKQTRVPVNSNGKWDIKRGRR